MIREVEITKSALQKVKAQKENFGIMDRFDVEKQIPKKPKTDDRYVMYICPCCNDFVKVSHNYCQNCGQKLDWSDRK